MAFHSSRPAIGKWIRLPVQPHRRSGHCRDDDLNGGLIFWRACPQRWPYVSRRHLAPEPVAGSAGRQRPAAERFTDPVCGSPRLTRRPGPPGRPRPLPDRRGRTAAAGKTELRSLLAGSQLRCGTVTGEGWIAKDGVGILAGVGIYGGQPLPHGFRYHIVLNIRGESYRLREKRQAGLFPSQHHLNTPPEEAGDNYRD